VDGPAGERRAASILTTALCAEATHATAGEDDDKIDMKLSIPHAFRADVRIPVHCQVKSGNSYLSSANESAFHLKNVSAKSINILRAGTRPALILWVPPPPREDLYWYGFGLRQRDSTPLKIPRWHRVSPAMRYDLTRIFERCSPTPRAPRLDVTTSSVDHDTARAAYRNLAPFYAHPLAGTLRVSWLAWRHVTRKSKPKAQREQSLRLVRYLPRFLDSSPDRFSTVCDGVTREGNWTRRRSWTWCWYHNALRIDEQPHRLLVRFREDIVFPTNWRRFPLAESQVEQTAVLESWWARREER
jgi:hypothetical protein